MVMHGHTAALWSITQQIVLHMHMHYTSYRMSVASTCLGAVLWTKEEKEEQVITLLRHVVIL